MHREGVAEYEGAGIFWLGAECACLVFAPRSLGPIPLWIARVQCTRVPVLFQRALPPLSFETWHVRGTHHAQPRREAPATVSPVRRERALCTCSRPTFCSC